jgi:hypothetical protein
MENPIVLMDAERVELNQRAASRSWRADDFKGIHAGQHFGDGQGTTAVEPSEGQYSATSLIGSGSKLRQKSVSRWRRRAWRDGGRRCFPSESPPQSALCFRFERYRRAS